MDTHGRRARVVELVRQIDDLRARLARAEAELDELLPDDDAAASGASALMVSSHGARTIPGSLASRIVDYVTSQNGKDVEVAQVAEALGVTNINSIRGTLQRLVTSKRIGRAGWGKYRARIGG